MRKNILLFIFNSERNEKVLLRRVFLFFKKYLNFLFRRCSCFSSWLGLQQKMFLDFRLIFLKVIKKKQKKNPTAYVDIIFPFYLFFYFVWLGGEEERD